jgi:hypothetical protein
MALHVCVACHRHIRRNACDFCGHLNDFAPAPVRSLTNAGTRAALVLGTALALGACQSDTSDPTPPGLDAAYGGPPIEDATPPGLDAAYGGPPIEDAGPTGPDAAYGGPPIEDAGVVDAAPPDTGPVAAYGGPPIDANVPVADASKDAAVDAARPDSGPVAAYGGPPLEPDAMPAAPAYGAPPM